MSCVFASHGPGCVCIDEWARMLESPPPSPPPPPAFVVPPLSVSPPPQPNADHVESPPPPPSPVERVSYRRVVNDKGVIRMELGPVVARKLRRRTH